VFIKQSITLHEDAAVIWFSKAMKLQGYLQYKMELLQIIQNVARGHRNPRKTFKEFGAERPGTLEKPFVELDEEVVLVLVLNWMANNGKNGDKFNIRLRAEGTTYVSVARIYATRMTVTIPVKNEKWEGRSLYVWKASDCYHNLTALSLKSGARRAKVLNWHVTDGYDDTIDELFQDSC